MGMYVINSISSHGDRDGETYKIVSDLPMKII